MKISTFLKSLIVGCFLVSTFAVNAQVYLQEDFSTATGSTPPAGWVNNTITGCAFDVWRFDNPGGRVINAPMSSPVAVFDSDNYSNPCGAENVALESPTFSVPASASYVALEWDQDFEPGFGGEWNIEVWDGSAWVNVVTSTAGSNQNPSHQHFEITSLVAGVSNARVRFRWEGDFSWWWIIDNVIVHETTPPPPSYCESGASSTADSRIDLVRLIGCPRSINNNTSTSCGTYNDYTSQVADIFRGGTHTLTVRAGTCGGTFTKSGKAYIDYNQDFDFDDSGEQIAMFGPGANATYNVNFTVPMTADLGSTRMRVIVVETSTPSSITPCGTFTWGETEDYTVNIQDALQYDAAITDQQEFEYTAIPISQTPIDLSATASNVGTSPLTGVVITTNVYQGGSPAQGGVLVASQSSTPTSLAPGATTTYNFTGGFQPNVSDNYYILHSVSTIEPDNNPCNDTLSSISLPGGGVKLTTSLYSRDDSIPVDALGFNPGFSGAFGNTFEIVNTAVIRGGIADLGFPGFGGGPAPGSEWRLSLWSVAGGTPDTLIAYTNFTTVNGLYQPNVEFFFPQPIILQPGEYLLAIEDPASNGPVYVTLTGSIYNAQEHWVNNNGWQTMGSIGFASVPAVRMVLDGGCLTAIAGFDTTICEGADVTLGGNPAALLGTPPYTYQWTPAASLDNPSVTNPVASPTSTTTYTLTVTDALGCFSTDQVTVTVNNVPPVIITGLDTVYCMDNGIVNISGSPAGGTWSGPGVSAGGGGPITRTYSGPPVSIPDGSATPANANLNVTGLPGTTLGGDIILTQVCFEVTHTWVGDLTVELVAPDGTIINLTNRPGGGNCTGDNIDACVVPGTGNDMNGTCAAAAPTISGTFTASAGFNLGNVNNGGNANGQWTLRARDFVGFDAGTIDNFTLTFATGQGVFDPAAAGPGTHTISYCYTGANGCTGCAEQTVVVRPRADASINVQSPLCLSTPAFNLQIVTPGGVFSGTGIIDPVTGLFDPMVAGVGSHWVYYEVTDAFGCFGRDSANIVIRDIPTANAGADLTICSGSSVIIGGSPTGTPGTSSNFIVQYDWQPTTGLNSNTDPNPTASPLVTTTYTVTVTDGNGCTDTDEITVTVNDGPVIDAGANTTLCSGNTITLGGFPTAQGGMPPYTYQWTPATGLTTATGPNPDAMPNTTTTYTLVVTDANGCSSSDMVTVTVTPSPIADAGADKTVCSGTPVMIGGMPAATGGAGGYTFMWAPSTGLSAANIANPMANPATTTIYTLTVTDINGCTSTDAVTLTVNQSPIVDAGANTNICSGETITIGGFPTATGGLPPFTYSWSPSVGLNSTTVQNPVASPTSTTTYTITVTDSRGCTSTDMITVTVNPVPVANAGGNATVCLGDFVTIGGSPTASMGTAPYSYSWSPSNGLSSTTAANPQASPNFTTTYTVTVTDANGCMATSSVTVNTRQSPIANAGVDKSVCIGESVMIGGTPAGVGGTGALSYSWSPSAGLSGVNIPNPTAFPNTTRTYVLTVSDANGCVDRDTVTVTVNPLPNVSIIGLDTTYCTNDGVVAITGNPAGGLFSGPGIVGSTFDPAIAGEGWHIIGYTYTDPNGCTNEFKHLVRVYSIGDFSAGPDLMTCFGQPVTLEATGPDGVYRWEPAGLVSDPNIKNPTATVSETTTFTLTISTAEGCEGTDEVVVEIDPFCGIVPPNTFTPDGDGLNETWIIPALDQFPNNTMLIFNRWGTVVFEQDNYTSGNAWDGGDLPEGTYFYVITIDHPAHTGKAYKGTITIIRN